MPAIAADYMLKLLAKAARLRAKVAMLHAEAVTRLRVDAYLLHARDAKLHAKDATVHAISRLRARLRVLNTYHILPHSLWRSAHCLVHVCMSNSQGIITMVTIVVERDVVY